jgi:hypothetical protein
MDVFVDIDMTLADNTKRLQVCLRPDKTINYDCFFAADKVLADEIISDSRETLGVIRENYHLVFLTARPKQLIYETKKWLLENNLYQEGDELIIVDSPKDKLSFIKIKSDQIYLYIDDFKYDYQSGQPKISDYVLPKLDEWSIPYVIFNNNWSEIAKNYF